MKKNIMAFIVLLLMVVSIPLAVSAEDYPPSMWWEHVEVDEFVNIIDARYYLDDFVTQTAPWYQVDIYFVYNPMGPIAAVMEVWDYIQGEGIAEEAVPQTVEISLGDEDFRLENNYVFLSEELLLKLVQEWTALQ